MYVCNYEQLVEICSQLYTYICKPVSSEHRLFLMNNRQLVDLDSEKEVSTRKRTGVKNTAFGKLTQKLIVLKAFQQIKFCENRSSIENYLH